MVYALACIRSEKIRDLVGTLCEPIESLDAMSAISYGLALLKMSFGQEGDPFSPHFVKVLKTLAHSKKFNAFNVNAREVLNMWLLPDEEELDALATRMEAEKDPVASMVAWFKVQIHG